MRNAANGWDPEVLQMHVITELEHIPGPLRHRTVWKVLLHEGGWLEAHKERCGTLF